MHERRRPALCGRIEEAFELPGRVLDDLAPARQPLGQVTALEDHPRVDDVAYGRRQELEGRDNAESAAGTAQRPEQVRVVGGVGADGAAVGQHDLGGDDVVDREPVLAGEKADPAGGGQPAEPTPP